MIINILHSFTNIFAGGRSEIKIILFIIYTLFFLTIFFIFKNKENGYLKGKYVFLSFLVTYIYGFLLYVFIIIQNKINIFDFFITAGSGELSSSSIYHTHIAKSFFGQIFSLFNKTKLETMDAGGAFIGLIPSIFLYLGILLFIVSVILTIIHFKNSFLKQIRDKETRQKIFLLSGYIVITFSIIKTSIDGGMFHPNLIIAIFFIVLFYLREKGKDINKYYYIIIFTTTALILSSLYIDSFKYGNGLFVSSFATTSLLYSIFLYGSEKKIRLQFLIPLIILFLISWFSSSIRDREIYNYGKIQTEKGQEIYFYNEEEGLIKNYIIEENQEIISISNKLNKNITYQPITIPGTTCMLKSPREKISFELRTEEPIKNLFKHLDFVSIKNSESSFNGKNWATKIDFYMNSCTPEPLSVINGELLKNNIKKYFILNPTFNDTYNY